MDIQKRILATAERLAPEAKGLARIAGPAVKAFDRDFKAETARWRKRRQQRAGIEKAATAALLRPMAEDKRFLRARKAFDVAAEATFRETAAGLRVADSAARRVMDLHPLDIPGGLAGPERTLDIFGPPYPSDWMNKQSARAQQQHDVAANKQNGAIRFLYTIGQEGGWVSDGAAIFVHFAPPTGAAEIQIRPYTPFQYVWHDNSYLATAHNSGGFGIKVSSFAAGGGGETLEQNHRYEQWSDGTSWYEEHNSPSFPGTDDDHAFLWGHEAPWFPAKAGRLYSAAVWCFGQADASGASTLDASYAQGAVMARVGFVVVAYR